MKFGLFSIAPWHESMTPEQVLHDSLEQIELGDRLGLDEVWLASTIFRGTACSPASSHIAAKSRRAPKMCALAPP